MSLNSKGQTIFIVLLVIAIISVIGVFMALRIYRDSKLNSIVMPAKSQPVSKATALPVSKATSVDQDLVLIDQSLGKVDLDGQAVDAALNDEAVNLN